MSLTLNWTTVQRPSNNLQTTFNKLQQPWHVANPRLTRTVEQRLANPLICIIPTLCNLIPIRYQPIPLTFCTVVAAISAMMFGHYANDVCFICIKWRLVDEAGRGAVIHTIIHTFDKITFVSFEKSRVFS